MIQSNRNQLVELILKRYGVAVKDISEPQTGYRNHSYKVEDLEGALYNLMVFKNEPDIVRRINNADSVARHVSTVLPVRMRLDERITTIHRPSGDTYAALYNYLPGSTIEWGSYTKDHLKVTGIAMAKMHSALSNSTALTSQNTIYTEFAELLGRIESYFSKADVVKAANDKLGVRLRINYNFLVEAVNAAKHLKNQHSLHMDFVRGNILFDTTSHSKTITFGKAHLTGIIDFEKTAVGSPLFDMARTLAFLYVDCKYKSHEKIRKYFLYSGYVKYGDGTIGSKALLDHYVKIFLLHDFYKFLLHNPYEDLYKNEHFIRTRDILISLNMVEYRV